MIFSAGKKRVLRALIMAVVLIPLMVGYVNCGGGEMSSSPNPPAPLAIPDPTCGPDGFEFLMQNYFSKYCTECHTKAGFNPKFADPSDMEYSFAVAQSIVRSTLLKTVTQNTFCGSSGCNLDTADPLYKAIDQWTTMRYACP